ncbi:MAG: glycogen/starch/alpha-glucan family phosphorylase, partial [Candidatus Omnitrophica bacterium]|nr:glycogen/starch/alpha-glucan family phosphorylase [Candidatus Omnitrophota bacterium]
LEIGYEMNARFLNEVSARFPGDNDRLSRMSLIEEGESKRVRMSSVAILASQSVNGVSALHSDLLKKTLFKDFFEMFPKRFNNKTNGITQRRWLLKSNPPLSNLVTDTLGDGWVKNLEELQGLKTHATKKAFQERWRAIKLENKKKLAEHIQDSLGLTVDTASMFDVQVKRIHEYKRQLLFAFFAIAEYLKIKNDPKAFKVPRTLIVGGKAAPGYAMAKLIIKLINSVGEVINRDPATEGKLRLLFLPNYCVSLAEKIFPASELSEQISLAGTEASGTGNMKFMLNGALTIGTLDGANVEMHEAVGNENIYIFGMRAHEAAEVKSRGYNPSEYVNRSPVLKEIFRLLNNNFFSLNQPEIFKPIIGALLYTDAFMVAADFDSYIQMQERVGGEYLDAANWTRKSILNTACSGRFSSDRTIRDYAEGIWKIKP